MAKATYQDKAVRIYCGHVLDILPQLPAESVHTCITSPPYWGLRDYGLPASVWGGEPGCEHEWGAELSTGSKGHPGDKSTLVGPQTAELPKAAQSQGQFCTHCNAWRGCFGLEPTPEFYVQHTVEIFREVRRVLRGDGTLWLNLGDSYAANSGQGGGNHLGTGQGNAQHGHDKRNCGLKPKDLCGIPWRVAFALQADGWYLRSDIIWHKPNPMPESVQDRPTKAHEYLFLFSKNAKYFYDAEAIREESESGPSDVRKMLEQKDRIGGKHKTLEDPLCKANAASNIGRKRAVGDPAGRNKRSVWTVDNPGELLTYLLDRHPELADELQTDNKPDVWTISTKPFTGWTKTDHRVRAEEGVPGGDTKHTTSADCPVHGCPDRPGGEREDDSLSHTGSTGACHETEQPLALGDSSKHPAPSNQASSSDSPAPPDSSTAKPRSNRKSKTAPAPETTSPCTPSDKTALRTGSTSGRNQSAEPHPDTPGNNTSAADSGDSPGSQNQNRTVGSDTQQVSSEACDIPSLRKLGCTCEFYQIITKETSHFAVFPPDLIEPCILAGTSDEGCCPECRAPWRRVVEKERKPTRPGTNSKYGTPAEDIRGGSVTLRERHVVMSKTTGWEPGCECGGDPVPCTVLDPFMGSGTTAVVAKKNGRHAIGIELNPEYIEMAKERMPDDLLF